MQKIELTKFEELDYRSNESYKSLRTNIQFCGNDIKVILSTSCTQNEGKSRVTFNLADSFAQMGKKVLLIDADLRKSVLIGRYRVNQEVFGLSEYLSGQKSLDEVLCETNHENLNVIFSGHVPPNPAELLGNQYFADLVKWAKEEYDYVFIDTPPLGVIIDSAVVARVADGAIIVIENNAISRKFVLDVKKQLEKSNCRILGAVLNKVSTDTRGKYGKYYGNYYGKYYGHYGEYGLD